jgi:formyl-CoA transferase
VNAPLAGLVVIAVEQAVAAPFCTARLADAGARVIKIERPEGDFARLYDNAARGSSSYFFWLNRGKQSVVLDLAQESARRQLGALIAGADVLVQNLKPGAMERMAMGIEELRRHHPRLICCSISGYGETGPLSARKAYDLLVQAESGLASITGGASEPARVGISIVDIATGATAHAAILEALISRGQSGDGADLRISMFDVIADWLTVPLLNTEAGMPPKRFGLAHPSIAPYGIYSTADNQQVLIAIQSKREWAALCVEVLQAPAIVDDPRFSSNVARVAHRTETDSVVAKFLGALSAEVLIARLNAADIAFASFNDIAALSKHPHLRRIQVATETGLVAFPAPAVRVRGCERHYGSVPALGEHTDKVLEQLKATKSAVS